MSPLAILPIVAAAAAATNDDKLDQTETTRKFAACVARLAPSEARGLVMMDTLSTDYTARLAAVINGPAQKCKKKAKGVSVGTAHFAGMIAEALIHARFQPTMPVEELRLEAGRRPFPARNAAESLGLCTVTRAPAASTQLIAAQPGSPAETRAADAIRTAVNGCLKGGTRVNANAPALRALVSLAAWRVVSAERVR